MRIAVLLFGLLLILSGRTFGQVVGTAEFGTLEDAMKRDADNKWHEEHIKKGAVLKFDDKDKAIHVGEYFLTLTAPNAQRLMTRYYRKEVARNNRNYQEPVAIVLGDGPRTGEKVGTYKPPIGLTMLKRKKP